MKVGLGIVTYNRPEYFDKCIDRVPFGVLDHVVVVNDGTPYDPTDKSLKEKYHLIQNSENRGVSISKNKAMKHLMNMGCDYIFIMEDDILIRKASVFDQYIKAYLETGIHHFNYGLHGLANKKEDKETPNPRVIIEYGNDIKVALNLNCVGAFSFYTRKSLQEIGYIDENFHNAFDHVEHSYRLASSNYHPQFWWFPDLANSQDLLEDIPWTKESSTISSKPNHNQTMIKSLEYFHKKWGFNLFNIENPPMIKVQEKLKLLRSLR